MILWEIHQTNSACGTSYEFIAMVPAVNQENGNEGMGNPV